MLCLAAFKAEFDPCLCRPDAFERHVKVCAPKSGGPAAGGGGGSRGGGGVPNHDSRPRAYNCYLVRPSK
eukprot:1158828-Pelagomonas_calceolata.AAC.9